MTRAHRTLALIFPLLSCGPTPGGEAEAADEIPEVALGDTLVLRAGAVEVWWTAARSATDSSGTACVERALEIRTDGARRTVPLLYTREAPTRVDDSTMRAVLSVSCTPAGVYHVDLANARPRRMDSP